MHYYPGTSIVHYKGESTRKSSINYVLIFYRAMAIYAKKHFNSPGTFLLVFLLFIAIYFRAGLSIFKRLLSRLLMPALDAAVVYSGSLVIPAAAWEERISATGEGYPSENLAVLIPALILMWILSVYLSGGYREPLSIGKALRGILYGGLVIMIIYGMLSEEWYLKLVTILPLALWVGLGVTITRILLSLARKRYG